MMNVKYYDLELTVPVSIYVSERLHGMAYKMKQDLMLTLEVSGNVDNGHSLMFGFSTLSPVITETRNCRPHLQATNTRRNEHMGNEL